LDESGMLMKVNFKFQEDASDLDRAKVLQLLEDRGGGKVAPLFPGDADPELGSIFVAEVPDGTRGHRAIAALNRSKAVQYVEREPARKLIR